MEKVYNKNIGPQTEEERAAYLAQRRAYYLANKNVINQKNKEYTKTASVEQIERIKESQRAYGKRNRTKRSYSTKLLREKNIEKHREYMREYRKERKKTDVLFRFHNQIRNDLRACFKRAKFTKSEKFETLLGITILEFKAYLETKFEPGMSWENWGMNGWHLDHIIPKSSASTKEELEKLWHYTNLQPLWAADNIRKSNKLDWKK